MIAVTAPGRFGDILWSLPTAKVLAAQYGGQADFFIMPKYAALAQLIQQQSWVHQVYCPNDWVLQHSEMGAQPWLYEGMYSSDYPAYDDGVFHLGYRTPPSAPLIDFIAAQQAIQLFQPVPFIQAPPDGREGIYISYAFAEESIQQKMEFLSALKSEIKIPVPFIDAAQFSFREAASLILESRLFVGCRSANWVIACGVGTPALIYEPNPARRSHTFDCPYAERLMPETIDFNAFVAEVSKRIFQ